MAKLSTDELLDAIGEMTVLELSDLIKAYEEKFGVTAAAPMMAAAPAAAGGGEGGAEAAEEKDEFDVILTSAGEKKIQ
ncbi:MAG: 50S ribosomal protein L7/L12, partial [Actinomycetota bacterium]